MIKRQNPIKMEGSNKIITRGKHKVQLPLYPVASLNTEEREKFGQTVEKIGLRGLLELLWNYCDPDMANEVFGGKTNPEFKNTMRGEPKRITEKMTGQAFGISTDGEDAFGKGDNHALSYFSAQSISHTDG
jgi:hypothetical protein